jgi:hypothetical protein
VTSTHAKPAVTLPPDEVRAFEDILAVFTSPGWKLLAKQLEAEATSLGNVRNCADLAYTKGQLAVLDTIRNWPDTWASIYEAAQAGDVEVEPGALA